MNIEPQPSKYHWVAAGEASIWTIDSSSDFCRFAYAAYVNPQFYFSLQLRFDRSSSSVVDMSLLWLWWVAHTRKEDLQLNHYYFDDYILGDRKKQDGNLIAAFSFSKSLKLPAVPKRLQICNGMLVRHGAVFDHMHAWQYGQDFSLNIDEFVHGRGLPYANITSKDKTNHSILFFNNIHYQGDSKKVLLYDLCRILIANENSSTIRIFSLLLPCKELISAHIQKEKKTCVMHNSLCF